jgi:transposase
MLEESMPEHETEYSAIRHVGTKLGVGPETLPKWRRRAEIDSGARPGVTSEDQAEIKRLKRENAELRRANEILRTGRALFGRSDRRDGCCFAFESRVRLRSEKSPLPLLADAIITSIQSRLIAGIRLP